MLLRGLLQNMLKGIDNESLDAARVLWVVGAVAYLISVITFQGIALWKGQTFDVFQFCTGFGTGFAALFAAGGWGIRQKDTGVAVAQATGNPL